MEKFFEDDELILALEQYLSDCKCNVLKRYIESIKAIALQKGLPYQSLISSIIHQVATRQIKI